MKSHEHNHNLNVKKVDRLSPTQVRLTLAIDGDTFQKEEERTAHQYGKAAKLPGFRPGRAPLNMVRAKYADRIRQDVVSHLLEAGLAEALEETKLVPINRPKVKLEKLPENPGDGFEFQAEFEVRPEIELRSYKGVPIKAMDVEATDAEVAEALEGLRERMAVLEPVEQDTPEKGMFGVAEIGFHLKEDPEQKEAPGSMTVELGEGKLLAELDEALMSMKVGEEKEITAKLPEDFGKKEFAGKEAVFQLKLQELKKKSLPELDDAFAAQVQEGSTLEELKKNLRENIASQKQEESRREQRKEIVDFLVANHKFDVPASLVENQSRSLLQWMVDDMRQRGLREFPQLGDEQIQELRKRAEHMVRSSLLLREIATKEKITLSEELVKERVQAIAAQLDQSVEATEKLLRERGVLDRIQDEVLTDQVFDFLVKNAKVVESSPRAKSS